MENLGNITRVEQSLGLSFKLAWIFGVPSIRVPYILRVIYASILILFFTVAYLCMVWVLTDSPIAPLNVRVLFCLQQVILVSSVYLAIIVWVVRGAKTVQKTVMNLNEVDEVFKADQIDYKLFDSHFRNQLWGMRLQILLCSVLVMWDLKIALRAEPTTLLFSLRKASYIVITTVRRTQLLILNILFCAVIRTIHLRFLYINRVLYRMGKASNVDIPNTVERFYTSRRGRTIRQPVKYEVEEMIEEIDVLHKMHKRLRIITDNLTDGFWPRLCSYLLSVLILSMYYITIIISRDLKTEGEWYSAVANHIIEYSQTIAECWLVMSSCENLSDEANKFGRMLHIIDLPDPAFQRQLQRLSLNHTQDRVTVTAGGLFVLELPRLIYVLSSMLGYAVIVYQMNWNNDLTITKQ